MDILRSVQTESSDPIFIVGTGRCGSTILYSLLAMHPSLAWIPSYLNVAPSFPLLAAVTRIWGFPGMDKHRQMRFLPKAVEPNQVFSHVLADYYSEVLDKRTIEEAREKIAPLVEKIKRYEGKSRFLAKMVGRPVKVALLREIYPDARFLFLTRDLNPTVASLLRVDFYVHTEGSIDRWRWDAMPDEFLKFYHRSQRAPEIGAAISITMNGWQIRRQLGALPASSWMEIAYGAFVADPVGTVRAIGARTGLAMDERFLSRIARRRVYRGADEKWRQHLTSTQQHRLAQFQEVARAVGQSAV